MKKKRRERMELMESMKKKRRDDERLFSYLPLDNIIMEILSRLPTKTIRRYCQVGKLWQELISSPEFANLRRLRQPQILMVFYRRSTRCFLNMVELVNEPTGHDFYYLPGSIMQLPQRFDKRALAMFGSINGLFCFHEKGYYSCPDKVHIWNPLTKESISIQSSDEEMKYPDITTHGFGLSSVNGHYKVVKICHQNKQGWPPRITKSECYVYTLGQGRWRRHLGDAQFIYSRQKHGLFLHGNLHWLGKDPDRFISISCFDLEKETFKRFQTPPGLGLQHCTSLEVYKDNYVSVCDNSWGSKIAIWVMKEYGVEGSWVKEFVIDKNHIIHRVCCFCEAFTILKVFEDGEILVSWRNAKDNYVGMVKHDKLNSSSVAPWPIIEAVDYVPSFVSLKSLTAEMVVEDASQLESISSSVFF